MALAGVAAPAAASAASSVSGSDSGTRADLESEIEAKLEYSQRATKEMYLANYRKPLSLDPAIAAMVARVKVNQEYAEAARVLAATAAAGADAGASAGASAPAAAAGPRRKPAAAAASGVSVADADAADEKTEAVTVAPGVVLEDVTHHKDKRRRLDAEGGSSAFGDMLETLPIEAKAARGAGPAAGPSTALVLAGAAGSAAGAASDPAMALIATEHMDARTALILKNRSKNFVKPTWHAPWKLKTVISGHTGWVRCIAVDPANEWFATGGADRTIKIWDLASGTLKLTLTGHINTIRGLAISDRHPYMFSVAEDKKVLCWDLETNKVIRHYHGHLSGVYSLALHPTLDVLVTGARDSSVRVWDMRTKAQIRALTGHTNTIASLACQSVDPQIISGSHDSTIRLWDLAAGKCSAVLTNHKKSVRALCVHPKEYTFASAGADNIKVWKGPDGEFLRNMSGHNAIVNAIAINRENVFVSGGDNGSIQFWDWKSGYAFQSTETKAQPGSLDSESGIFSAVFDHTGTRLITSEADKTVKIWREDEAATETTHPIDFKPDKKRKRY